MMFTQSDIHIEGFFKDRQWVVPGQATDNVSFETLYAHYCKWARSQELQCVTGDHFFTVCAVAHPDRLGLTVSRYQTEGVVVFERMSLLMHGSVVDADLWPDFDYEQALLDCIHDPAVFELGIKKRILRATFFKMYSSWCESKNYPVLGKIKLFEILRTSTRVQECGVRLGFIQQSHIVVRGLDAAEDL
jgi:hypothetical protein